ncbi:TraB/GumN family protein [Paenisporosarcina antarctica]|nr:TraB/GumN family protein [Paenisporosarcina antarctica]
MFFFTACSPLTSTKQDYFKDKALESIVLQEIESEDGNLEEDDFASIKTLDASGSGISDINGIESLTSLNYLDVSGNDIVDLTPLLTLEKLSEVHLGDVYFTGDMDAPVWSVPEKLEEKGVEVNVRERLSFDEHDGPSEGVFYRIQKDNQTVYLLGSIHIGDQSLYPLHNQIEAAFEEADYLAVEIDIADVNEIEVSKTMMEKGMYTDGTVLSSVVSEKVFNEAAGHLSSLGLNEVMLDQFQPWFVSMILSEVALEKTNLTGKDGIDLHFLNRAKEKNIPIISLESVESQIASISSAPKEEQIASLEDMLDTFDIYEEELTQLIRLWRSGNIEVFSQLRQINQGSEQLAMDERDLLMTGQIEEFLNADERETYFIVVGSLHLAGKNSIVDLLENRGYTVEPHAEFRTN